MSSQCPECQNPIDADFGVITCPKCFSVLFVDMEGNVQLSEKSQPDPAVPFMEAIPEAPEGLEQNFNDSWMQDQNPGPSEPLNFEAGQSLDGETVPPSVGNFEEYQQPSEDASPTLEMAGEFEAPEASGDFQAISSGQYQQEPAPFQQFDENPEPDPEFQLERNSVSEVAEFSNSDQATGPLSYSILIEAIDTKEIREQLADVLSDSKFQWDPKELLKTVKMGRLKLENINPVKASVLVSRLQTVPVKVSWVQNVFS